MYVILADRVPVSTTTTEENARAIVETLKKSINVTCIPNEITITFIKVPHIKGDNI